MTKITEQQVKHIAQLVKLDITGQENILAKMFDETLDYIKILDGLDTEKVKETYQVTGLCDVYQIDHDNQNTLKQQEVLKNAKNKVDGLFVTSAVLER